MKESEHKFQYAGDKQESEKEEKLYTIYAEVLRKNSRFKKYLKDHPSNDIDTEKKKQWLSQVDYDMRKKKVISEVPTKEDIIESSPRGGSREINIESDELPEVIKALKKAQEIFREHLKAHDLEENMTVQQLDSNKKQFVPRIAGAITGIIVWMKPNRETKISELMHELEKFIKLLEIKQKDLGIIPTDEDNNGSGNTGSE